MTIPREARPIQGTFDELLAEQPLHDVTFTVVDLETTGATAAQDAITEIGAVKVRGGEMLGEFATLVNPQQTISPFITHLTGITPEMVATAPPVATVLPSFMEFAQGSVLVAHNARFDIGFLRAASKRHDLYWPQFRVVDTVALARQVVTRDEVPNHKLATLAQLFRSTTSPNHRALDDARATVDVLYGLLERLGGFGVQTLSELTSFTRRITAAQRSKRHLADHLPSTPGVYIFRATDGRPLYVGTSRNIRTRVRNYFTASEPRTRMGEMVTLASHVEGLPCAHALEAQVRELRLIAAHKPPYNRRSKYPEKTWWLTLTDEPFPRLSLVRKFPTDRLALGPFTSRNSAHAATEAIYEALPLRQCTKRLSPHTPSSECVLAEMGRCGAPCSHRESRERYAHHVAQLVHAVESDAHVFLAPVRARIDALAAAQRFENAAELRDRLGTLLRILIRGQRLLALTTVDELVAARRDDHGGWELALIRRGRLAAADHSPRTDEVLRRIALMSLTAETASPKADDARAQPPASREETEHILAWLDKPGVRIVRVTGVWACPIGSAERWRDLLGMLSPPDSALR